MNEELKIKITADTGTARKNIKGVKDDLKGTGEEAKKSGGKMSVALKAAGVAAAAASAAIIGVITALTALASKTKQYREEQARLTTAFQAAGGTAQNAQQAYKGLFRFMGDSDTASEAAAHLAKLTTNEKELAEWTTTLQGVYATFGKSLPIEGLTEAANETAKVGQTTGVLADALNWAGISEDAFNESLKACNSEAEREKLIRNTLNGIYADAALIYEENNKEIIASNEAQARLDAIMAKLGKTAQPLLTALTNLSATLLEALAPAITVITNALTWLINVISRAVSWVSAFFAALSGKSGSVSVIEDVASSLNGAGNGAGGLKDKLDGATGAAKALKKQTAGFDELNVLQDPNAGGSGGGGGGSAGTISGGITIDSGEATTAMDDIVGKMDGFLAKIREKLGEIGSIFEPFISGFKGYFSQIGSAVVDNLPKFSEGLEGFKSGLGGVLTYLGEEFVPNIVNSWGENVLPMFGDIATFKINTLGTVFQTLGTTFSNTVNDLILPSLQTFETIATDCFTKVGEVWSEKGGELMTNLDEVVAGLAETWNTFYDEVVGPVLNTITAWVDEIWEENLKPLWDVLVEAVVDIANNIAILWNEVLKPVVDWILGKIYPVVKSVIDNILAYMKTFMTLVSDVVQGIIKVIKGIIAFITGVFTGDWEKAWNGIKDILDGIWQAIWGVIKGIANMIIDGINALWSGIYHAVKGIVDTIGDIAGVVGNLLGQNWKFSMPDKPPLIPKLAKGGIAVGDTLAHIGEDGYKEAVLPLERNTEWMDVLADKIAGRSATPTKVVLMVNERELGYATINGINGITRQTGELQLALY